MRPETDSFARAPAPAAADAARNVISLARARRADPSRPVLVFGDDLRAFLSVVRSLGRRGLEVHACAEVETPALLSRHIARRHFAPPYDLDPSRWRDFVRDLIGAHGYALLIPCDDRAVIRLTTHAEALDARIAVANAEALDVFSDKAATRDLALSLGVPVARGATLSKADDADALVRRFGLPLALKPRRSVNIQRTEIRRAVRILRDRESLVAALAALDRSDDHVVESFVSGAGVGLSILADRGEVLHAFQHARVRQAGPTSGSSLRVSEEIDPRMMRDVAALATATRLSGVAMFEFIRRADDYVLLEVNARFWGSLPLAIASGVDFPAELHDLMVRDARPAPSPYRVGHFSRALSSDVHAVLNTLRNPDLTMSERAATPVRECLSFAARGLSGVETIDSFAWDDLVPMRAEVLELASDVANAVSWRVPGGRLIRQWDGGRRIRGALRKPGGPLRLLFLCQGNICRSPFAAGLLRERVDGRDFEILSAGLLPWSDRPSPDEALAEARKYGVELARHRSRYADDDLVRACDAVIAFDRQNLDRLRRRGFANAMLLAVLAGVGAPEILDPFGGGALAFDAAYAEIDRAIAALAAKLHSLAP